MLGAGKADSGYFPFHRRVILLWGHNVNYWVHPLVFVLPSTVEPRVMDTRLIRTPHYYGHFSLSLVKDSPYIFCKFNPLNTDTSLLQACSVLLCPWGKKALTFSLNSTRSIRTPINEDNGHLFLAQSTDSHRRSTLLMRTLHYQILCCNSSFLPEGKKSFCLQHFDVPSATVHRIVFKLWLFWHPLSYAENGFD